MSEKEVVEVVTIETKGKWEINPDGYYPYCSECNYEPPWVEHKDMRTPFCPNCGKKMSK